MTSNPVVHYTVQVQPGDPLEDLCARWMKTKAAADTAVAELEDLKAQIKFLMRSETDANRPDANRIHLSGMIEVPLTMTYTEPRKFNTKRFQAEHGDLYEQYRPTEAEVAGKGSWALKEA